MYCLTVPPKVRRNFPTLSCTSKESTKLTLKTEKSIKITTNVALVIVARDCLTISPQTASGQYFYTDA